MRVTALGSALALFAVAASAQPAGAPLATGAAPPAPTTGMSWLSRPSGEDLSRFYPQAAQERGLTGAARLRCHVQSDGRLAACYVVAETPLGLGFGDAAMRMARLFRLGALDGQPAPEGATVVIPIVMGVDGEGERLPPHLVLSRAQWSAAPTGEQVATAGVGLTGRARLHCVVDGDRLTNCITPEADSAEVSAAARQLAPLFRLDRQPELAGRDPFDAEAWVSFTASRPDPLAHPSWRSTPTAGEVEAAFLPLAAAQTDHTARAQLDCRVGETGVLDDCRVASATPEAAGPALMALAPRFAVRPWSEDGYPTAGARVRVPLRYVAD